MDELRILGRVFSVIVAIFVWPLIFALVVYDWGDDTTLAVEYRDPWAIMRMVLRWLWIIAHGVAVILFILWGWGVL